MRFTEAFLALGLFGLLAVCGCKKAEYQAQCRTTITTLGVGYENADVPADEPALKAQMQRMTTAVDAWTAAKDTVKLADLRTSADTLAAVVAQRKTLLAGVKLVPLPPVGPGASLEAQAEAMQRRMLGGGDSTVDNASRSALTADGQTYHAAFDRVMAVCSKM